jgi:hypothetical protein
METECVVCGGPVDAEGRCLNVGEFWHGEEAEDACLDTLLTADELKELEEL